MRQLSKIDQGLKATAQKVGGHRSRSPPRHSKHKEIDRNLSAAVQHCARDCYYHHIAACYMHKIMAVDPTTLKCNHHFSAEETELKNQHLAADSPFLLFFRESELTYHQLLIVVLIICAQWKYMSPQGHRLPLVDQHLDIIQNMTLINIAGCRLSCSLHFLNLHWDLQNENTFQLALLPGAFVLWYLNNKFCI